MSVSDNGLFFLRALLEMKKIHVFILGKCIVKKKNELDLPAKMNEIFKYLTFPQKC